MHRYRVTLIGKVESFYADCYVQLGGVYQFYHGDTVVREFECNRVVRVIQIY
jgi:hypothetical protein